MKLLILSIAVLTVGLAAIAQTNAAAPPVVEKIDSWLGTAQTILASVASLLAVIMGIVAKIKATQASVISPLIRGVAAFGSKELEGKIKAQATSVGAEETLNKLVKAEKKEIAKEKADL